MVVTRDRIAGTIGGGHLEYEATRIAREALAGNAAVPAHWLVRFPLAARLGQCCGGVATLAFAVVDASAATWLDGVARLPAPRHRLRWSAALDTATRSRHAWSSPPDGALGTLGEARLDAAAVAAARARLGRRPVGASGGSGRAGPRRRPAVRARLPAGRIFRVRVRQRPRRPRAGAGPGRAAGLGAVVRHPRARLPARRARQRRSGRHRRAGSRGRTTCRQGRTWS